MIACEFCGEDKKFPAYYLRWRLKTKPAAKFFCSRECQNRYMQKDPTKKSRKINRRKNTVQGLANKYARLRDCYGSEGAACISCNKRVPFEGGDGGHFIAMGSSSALRYDERNINFQCHRCNRFLHGNTHNYYVGMVRKYGQEVVDELMARQYETKKWTDDELSEVSAYYKEKINAIKRGEPPIVPGNTGLAMSTLFADMAEAGEVHDAGA